MNAHAAAERTSTASPSARLEGGVVAVVEADLAREEPVLVELGVTGAGDGIHLVGAFPGEADAGRAVAAVEAALNRAEDEFATTLCIEADVGGLDQVEEVAVPQRHLDDPPLAEQRVIAADHQSHARSSAGLARPGVRSGMPRRELFGLPGPGQEPLELMGLGPTRDYPLEHVGQPRLGLDPVELRGPHQAGHNRPVAGSAIRPSEQAILTPEGHGTHRPLDGVGVQLEPAILKEQHQPLPVAQGVADRLGEGGLARDLPQLDGEPGVEGLHDRLAALLPDRSSVLSWAAADFRLNDIELPDLP